MRPLTSLLSGLCLATIAGTSLACGYLDQPQLAIIIDDLGYSLERGIQAAGLPAPVTLSIIPNTPFASQLASHAQMSGKEVMMHLPMTSIDDPAKEPLVLTADLSDEAFARLMAEAAISVPGATGVNNHKGSALTQDRVAMERLMRSLEKDGLFFIDSRTTAETIAATVAEEMAVPVASRSVFLDNNRDPKMINASLERAIAIARRTGNAVVIGHPYPETFAVLTEALPNLPLDVTMVPASALTGCDRHQRLTSIPWAAKKAFASGIVKSPK